MPFLGANFRYLTPSSVNIERTGIRQKATGAGLRVDLRFATIIFGVLLEAVGESCVGLYQKEYGRVIIPRPNPRTNHLRVEITGTILVLRPEHRRARVAVILRELPARSCLGFPIASLWGRQ